MSTFRFAWRLRDAYRATFGKGQWRRHGKLTEESTLTLNHLARFCYADRSTYDPDPREHALKEGSRAVWLEIRRVLELTDEELRAIRQPEDKEDD